MAQVNINNGDSAVAARNAINGNFGEVYGSLQVYTSQAYYGTGRSSTSYSAVVADTLYATPIVIERAVTIDALAMRVNSGIAATTALLGIYSDLNGRPDALLYQLTSALSTAGFASPLQGAFSANPTLPPGRYWLAALFSGAPTILAVSTTDLTNANVIGSTVFADVATNSVGVTGVSVARSYAAGLPNPFGASTVRSNVITPIVFFKVL